MAGGAGTAAVRKARQNGIAVVCGVGGGLVLRPVAWRSIPGNSLFTIAYGADTRAPGPRSRRRAAPAGTRSDAVGVAARLVRRARARGRGTRSARDLPAATASTDDDVSPLPPVPIRPTCLLRVSIFRCPQNRIQIEFSQCGMLLPRRTRRRDTNSEELYVGTTAGYAVAD